MDMNNPEAAVNAALSSVDNVRQFPNRSGLDGATRDGNITSRQAYRRMSRKEQEEREQKMAQMRQYAPDIYNDTTTTEDQKLELFEQFIKFHQPISRMEVQEIVMSFMSMYDKMAAEFRKVLTSQQAILRVLVNNGVIERADFEQQARLQIEWNAKVNDIHRAFENDNVSLNDILIQVREFNAVPANVLKIEAHHIDLAKRLLDDKGTTLEEKLLIAQEFSLPEAYLDTLRNHEYGRYNVPSLLATETPAADPTDAPASEDQQ